jgi:hypothetical protein
MTSLANAEKLTEVIARSVNVLSEVLADGKVDASDIPSLFKLIGVFQSASGINFSDFLIEVSHLDPQDVATITSKLSESLDISNDKAEETIKFWISFATKVYEILHEGYSLYKTLVP